MGDEKQKHKTVVITGGGTGGHLYPALAVAERLQMIRPEFHLHFIGREQEKDRCIVTQRKIPFTGLRLEGLRRRYTWRNLLSLLYAFWGWLRCLRLLSRFPKGVVFGVGGYVSAPAMIAGKLLGWKVVMHEQNTLPGLVNRLLAPRCDKVFITYEMTQNYLKGVDCLVTGFPLRQSFIDDRRHYSASHHPRCPSILLIGGSQGAKRLVEIGLHAFELVAKKDLSFQALVQTGERNYAWAQTLNPIQNVTLTPFIEKMSEAYACTDLVISRAGSGSLSEIALWGLPSILIPYPYASENHQKINAEFFAQNQAGFLIEEKELTPEGLAQNIEDLLQNQERRLSMGRQARSLAREDAADVIVQEMSALIDS